VAAPSFYLWKRKLRERAAGRRLTGSAPGEAERRPHFVPVQIDSSAVDGLHSAIRIRWPSGVQVEVPLAAGRHLLEQVLQSLSQVESAAGAGRE
jgi:hypothetical protein